ncbi:hypothetical protein K432DRAFT_383253 [Lepidopterella palustris CBS 459.81]|uniref:Uncharacterized protein n=1 Tax=Lepidopterella palustris CBS 459.81 TaxID=1314670 RepID=A0A8E2JE62_9PEZI|nr:hypothetical protein K432DRAFT_383253 [Lepidopterella palustris CBS 459.81]
MTTLNPENPSHLPPRYTIRQLTVEHELWARAIVCHSNLWHNPVWPLMYPHNKTQRLQNMMKCTEYLVKHAIASDMSFGVFDTAYKFNKPESKKSGGKLWWDEDDVWGTAVGDGPEEAERLLKGMDFPLVSILLSYDAFNSLDPDKMEGLVEILPLFGTMYGALEKLDTRNPQSWNPTGPNQVLMRNSTSTRAGYEGQGLMKKSSWWLMREAAGRGYRGIQIETAHDAVTHTWLHPPSPFEGVLVCRLDCKTYEADGEKPFEPATQVLSKIYVVLRE